MGNRTQVMGITKQFLSLASLAIIRIKASNDVFVSETNGRRRLLAPNCIVTRLVESFVDRIK